MYAGMALIMWFALRGGGLSGEGEPFEQGLSPEEKQRFGLQEHEDMCLCEKFACCAKIGATTCAQRLSGMRKAALPPESFPGPDPTGCLDGQRESELMGEHAHLPAMMCLVRDHVGNHGCTCGPRPRPTIPAKQCDVSLRSG